jgi:hypothetical protein
MQQQSQHGICFKLSSTEQTKSTFLLSSFIICVEILKRLRNIFLESEFYSHVYCEAHAETI